MLGKCQRRVADFFDPPPGRWGLRGDPYLWQEMAEAFRDAPWPATEAAFVILVVETFHRFVGAPLDTPETSVFVARYAHGGMSSGRVDPAFWRATALPLLRALYVRA